MTVGATSTTGRRLSGFAAVAALAIWVALPGWGDEADGDADGVADPSDNCVAVANADQLDGDRDGFGDACDCDYDNDGSVDEDDLELFKRAFGSRAGDPGFSTIPLGNSKPRTASSCWC